MFAEQLAQIRHAELRTMREHLERLQAAGFELPGDPAVLASAFNALLEGFCAIWIAGAGEPHRPGPRRRRGDRHPDRAAPERPRRSKKVTAERRRRDDHARRRSGCSAAVANDAGPLWAPMIGSSPTALTATIPLA
jgi:hypothetical protein